MTRKALYSTLMLMCLTLTGLAQSSYLSTLPVDGWWGQEGTPSSIDTMLLEVRPKGLYAEVSVTMDFSVRGNEWNFYEGQNLEIEMMFQLPYEAEVTDMWLWVFGIPEQAGIYDLWTATHIYDSIVDRRTDPAILYHYIWQNHTTGQVVDNLYRFQIFPLLTDMPRKAKITYQVPLKAGDNGRFQVPLPMGMVELSHLPIEQFTLRYFRGVEFGDAEIVELPGQPLVNTGAYEEIDLTGFEGSALNLSLQSQRPDKYLGKYSPLGSDTSFVQFGFTPSQLFSQTSFGKKTVVLFDHSANEEGHVAASTMTQQFVNALLPAFTEVDSLNIMFSGIVNQWMSDDWMVTDVATRDWIAQQLSTDYITGYSNITMQLVDAVQYLTENGGGGTIVLVSNSNQMANVNSTASFIQNMVALFNGKNIRVYVIDCDNLNTTLERFYYENH
ncbi:MAG: hypothetical protein K9J06_08675, partial [Flavobacteriales bacterium]|nr:hypothetical protein [Flavobacteriales bacterium]